MNAKKVLQAFRAVFPDSLVLAKDDVPLPVKEVRQPLYCNYHGKLRVVDDPVCQYHLESFDSWCWERCETEWTIKRLRPALNTAYRQHKDYLSQKAQVPFADGGSRNLWGDR